MRTRPADLLKREISYSTAAELAIVLSTPDQVWTRQIRPILRYAPSPKRRINDFAVDSCARICDAVSHTDRSSEERWLHAGPCPDVNRIPRIYTMHEKQQEKR